MYDNLKFIIFKQQLTGKPIVRIELLDENKVYELRPSSGSRGTKMINTTNDPSLTIQDSHHMSSACEDPM